MYKDELGTRMKTFYEAIPQTKLMRKVPVAIRIDGKAFHTFTRGFKKPFDEVLGRTMRETMKYLCENIQGCALGYTQSDEITLILVDYKKLNSEAWFDYEVQKMCSIAASTATMAFNKYFIEEVKKFIASKNPISISDEEINLVDTYRRACEKGAMFDARCFNIPKEETSNLIYWRQWDAIRNSIQMLGQANFSHKELQNKSCNEIKQMLQEQKNINWDELPTHLKQGSCCIKSIDPEKGNDHLSWKIDLNIPLFITKDRNYINERIWYEE